MSSKKTIQINPVFFRMKNTKKRREKKTKPKFNTTLKPNNIKKQLLQKIKEHQQSKQNDKIREDKENKANSQFKDNFSSFYKLHINLDIIEPKIVIFFSRLTLGADWFINSCSTMFRWDCYRGNWFRYLPCTASTSQIV